MRNPLWILLWVGTVAGAWYVGSENVLGVKAEGGGADGVGGAPSANVIALQEEVESLKAELRARGPALEGVEDAGAEGTIEGRTTVATPETEAFKPVHEFSLEGIQTAEEAVAHFIAYGKTMLSLGREGHLKLFEQMCAWGEDKQFQQKVEALFGSGERAIRHMVPMIQAALDHREDLADMQETMLVQMVENPEYFRDKDDDPLEVFTEGLGFLMPAVVSEERLGEWSQYVKAILDQDEKDQPQAIQRNRRELERLLRAWMPQMSVDEILKMLEGGVTPDEAMALLQQLPPDAIDKVDVGRYLAPKIAQGDWQAMRMLRRFRLSDASQANLDGEILKNAGSQQMHQWFFVEYLRATGRGKWDDARDFMERGLRSIDQKVRDKFASAIVQMNPGPDSEWARWALETFELSPHVRKQFQGKWKLQ